MDGFFGVGLLKVLNKSQTEIIASSQCDTILLSLHQSSTYCCFLLFLWYNDMIKNQQYSQLLQKLFNPFQNSLKIDLTILKQICSSQDHKRLIDLTGILSKLFLTGRQHLSIRELVGQSLYPSLSDRLNSPEREHKVEFFVDGLTAQELTALIRELQQVRKRLQFTIYSSKLAQILEMLRKVLHQVRAQPQKKEETMMVVGDIEIMQEEYRKAVAGNVFQVNALSKISDFLKNPKPHLQGKFSNSSTLLKYIANEIIPQLSRNVLSIPLINHSERQSQLIKSLQFIQQYFIVQYQIQIEISKNTLVQTRIYNNKFQRELLFRYRKVIIKAARELFNEVILTPSSIPLQILLLRILRRLYNLWDYTSAHSSEHLQNIQEFQDSQERSNNIVRNPIFLVLRNIALFSEGKEEELKEAAMFTYKVIQDKNDIQLVNLLENCEELRFLKNSKFYSSKAYTFADQLEKIYDPIELGSLYLKQYQCIPAREFWCYTILIEKPSSLICWQVYLLGYDLRFGVFKLDHLKDLSLEEYEKGVECREVIKMEKIQNLQNNPLKGHLYLKSGVYRLVFDNSFSMMRSKQICYSFLHLQSQA